MLLLFLPAASALVAVACWLCWQSGYDAGRATERREAQRRVDDRVAAYRSDERGPE